MGHRRGQGTVETPWGRQGVDWETWVTKPEVRMTTGLTKTMVWEKLPWFQGGSAYRLMRAVRQVILEEPRRMDMGCTVRAPLERYDIQGRAYTEPGPACGTIGCIAGWMHILTASTETQVYTKDPIGVALHLLPQSIR